MEITDSLISKAERLLLPAGCSFDEERRTFIKRLDSCDLLAVPGSGKTTALQAKLYCFANMLPLTNNAGIAVLSHTNAAVDEIGKNLKKSCPQLFRYPNFIGTVQDFVDHFLALPMYRQYYKHGVVSIDDSRYIEAVENYNCQSKFNGNPFYWFKNRENERFHNLRFTLGTDDNINLTEGITGHIFTITKPPKKWIKSKEKEGKLKELHTNLMDMKKRILHSGILCYDDCYFLASFYLKKFSKTKDILRKRFPYVFVDETQDLQDFQLKILDDLFDIDTVNFERIGDKNQSIFSKQGSNSSSWKSRNECYIRKSFRLTEEIANVVNNFTSDQGMDVHGKPVFVISGERVLDKAIKPHIFLYDFDFKDKLIAKFDALIEEYKLRDLIECKKYGFHIVGWNVESKNDPINYHLSDIFPDLVKTREKNAVDISTLSKMLQSNLTISSSKDCYNLVLDVICRILNLKGMTTKNNRKYTHTSLKQYVNSRPEESQVKFEKFVYKATTLINEGRYKDVYETMIDMFNATKDADENSKNQYNAFIEKEFIPIQGTELLQDDANAQLPSDLMIESVHSAKGKTHCATMYVETSYEGKYDAKHLIHKNGLFNPLFGDGLNLRGAYDKQAAKILYVGLSRPTHLLCYATLKKQWSDEDVQKMKNAGWIIDDLTII